jgi:hypothetical protein
MLQFVSPDNYSSLTSKDPRDRHQKLSEGKFTENLISSKNQKIWSYVKSLPVGKLIQAVKLVEKTHLLFVFTSLIHCKKNFKQGNTSCGRSKLPRKTKTKTIKINE